MTPLAYTPEQYGAFWAGVGALATVAAAIVAIISLLSIMKDSRDRARPVMVADLRPMTLSRTVSELVVQNVGVGVAKDVRVTFRPPINEEHGQIAAFLARRYGGTFPTVAPGRRFTNIYAQWRGDGSDELQEPVPKEFTVKITYKDSRARNYTDEYILTTAMLRNETTTSPSNTDDKGLQKRIANALEVIARGIDRR
jgi:hypothetical protein